MAHDPELTKAEVRRLEILMSHSIRSSAAAKDQGTLEAIYAVINKLSASAKGEIKKLERPVEYLQLVCVGCGFRWPQGVKIAQNRCPECRAIMRVLDTRRPMPQIGG